MMERSFKPPSCFWHVLLHLIFPTQVEYNGQKEGVINGQGPFGQDEYA